MNGGWSTHQLTEFLAGVSAAADARSASRAAVERAVEALEADLGALVRGARVEATIGFRAGEAPARELGAAARGRRELVEVPGLGSATLAYAPLAGGDDAVLMVGRLSGERFDVEDLNLLRGMGRVLELTLRMLRLLDGERAVLASLDERRRLFEQLERVQRSISERAPLPEMLDTVVEGAAALLDAPIAALRLVDSHDQSQLVTVSVRGINPAEERLTRRVPASRGAAGDALASGRTVAAADGARAALASPVDEHGIAAGALVVESDAPREWSASDHDLLSAYARHASLALAAAKAGETMRQAYNDPLTGLANRTLFLERLEHALARAQRSGARVTVLFLDVDRFKVVNDSLGHAAGDGLLQAVAERLRGCLRKAETAARLGGDEFAVLLDDGRDPGEGVRVAERILAVLRNPFEVGGTEMFVTASVGIASGRDEADDLLRNADVAMYRAKARGKDRFEVFEPGMHAAAVARLELEADLQRAIERDELVLHYQPVVSLADGVASGVEALVRWHHPVRGLVPPADFIPLAEETGLIIPIGRWVLGEACRQAAAWQRLRPLNVGVNISGLQLEHPDLEDEVRTAVASSGLDPYTLVLEITETTLMHDGEASVERLQALKRLGVRIAIDDFGTGYSSLRYLHRFPIDVLKIPKPFVDVLADSEEAVLARAIVSLSHNLGLLTVAEGIEHPQQAARLLRLGCSQGQGFFFARPLEAARVAPYLTAQRVAA